MEHRRKTRPGRLGQLDGLIVELAGDLLVREDGPYAGAAVIDLGVGARPWTTEELAAAVAPCPVIGVDLAEDVVLRAQEHARPGLSFMVGSFDLPVPGRLVRVMNVVRDLWPDEVAAAHARLAVGVLDGGVVVEGTCGPTGEVGTAHWLRKVGDVLVREGLLMWLDGTRGTAPLLFRDRLPRDLRRAIDHPIDALLKRWMCAHSAVVGGPRRLERSVEALGDPSLRVVAEGAVLWSPPGGVPQATGWARTSKSST